MRSSSRIRTVPRLLMAVLTFGLVACGSPVGEPCQLASGALGFGFDDPCKTKCLELSDVTCPDGAKVRKPVCAGDEGCSPGSCASGQACYSFEDPIETYFYCVPDDLCGTPLPDEDRLAWEQEARKRSDRVRAEFADRARRRTGKTTAPAAPAE